MPAREDVYEVIEEEEEYQRKKRLTNDKSIEFYLGCIAGYNIDLLRAVSHRNKTNATLDVFRKLATLCVCCLKDHGDDVGLEFSFKKYSVSAYVIMFQYYLNKSYKKYTTSINDNNCLEIILEMATMSIMVMEEHGIVYRDNEN